ncbi:hypothetical protein FAM09_25020 [Niastella caeni]|uniref:Lipoprotein n=1 Tax=Niastella caeni TaxID=2569763 RepID=A0A4V4GZN9_9BACT|nr:hypothetical protein [Niastella caeni]THU33416.1 hypothetical protein FAM09_25020 [Niastella caeni]
MNKLLYLLFLITVFSCEQPQSIKSKAGAETQKDSKYNSLLSLFNNVAIDTLEVYSTEDPADPMSGRAIDSINALFFPEDMAQWHLHQPPGLFAIYKFGIDSNRIGLLARTPSDYVPSSVKLFFFDMAKDSLSSYIELGERWGDAGDYTIKNSWLFRDSSRHVQILINVTNGHHNEVDDPRDTTVVEQDLYTLLDLSKPKIDTIFEDKEKLPKQYKSLVRNRTRK